MSYGMGATAIERGTMTRVARPIVTPTDFRSRSFTPRYRAGMLGLGDVNTGDISVGRLAKRDPLMAFTSVMASNLLRQASTRPAGTRPGAATIIGMRIDSS